MMAKQRRPDRRAGISLFEVLITISVLAILAAIALPALQSTEAQALESLARVVAADLQLARSRAIHHNTNYTVQFDSATNSYQILHTGTGTPPPLRNPFADNNTPDGVYRVDLDQFGPRRNQSSGVRFAGATLATSNSTVNDVTFGPIGGTGPARSEDTVIRLTSGSGNGMRSVTLTVSWITGQVWIERSAVVTPAPAGS